MVGQTSVHVFAHECIHLMVGMPTASQAASQDFTGVILGMVHGQ